MSSNLVIFLILFTSSGSLAARSRPTITLQYAKPPIYSSPNAEEFMEKWIVKNCPDLARKEDVNRMPADQMKKLCCNEPMTTTHHKRSTGDWSPFDF